MKNIDDHEILRFVYVKHRTTTNLHGGVDTETDSKPGLEKITDFFIQIKKIWFISFKSDFYDFNQISFIFPLDISVKKIFNGLPSPQNIVIKGKNMYTIHYTALTVILGDLIFLEFTI